MKIKKTINLVEATEKDINKAPLLEGETETIDPEELVVDDVDTAPVSEIADAIQDAAEVASDGKETFSDAKAEKIAQELKTYAKDFDIDTWAPLDVPNALTDALDECLANSMISKYSGTHDGSDLLVTGLPGSGKSAITREWAKSRGVELFYLNAKNDDLGAILNGFPVDTTEETEDGKIVHRADRSFSKSVDMLDRERSVLFLDEFNRAPSKLRATLLSLINEHVVEGPGEDGYRHFDNLLFSIACINPSVPTDPGALDLNDAEMSRFVDKLDWDSNVPDARNYFSYYLDKLINKCDLSTPAGRMLYKRYKKIFNLGMVILDDYRFNFDTRDDLLDLFTNKATILAQRSLLDGLMNHGKSKAAFLNWVDNMSGFLDKNKTMFHDILDPWDEVEIQLPTGDEAEANVVADSGNSDNSDFDAVFGTGGEETDTDLFSTSISKAGKAAKVDAAGALNRIKGFDFGI